MDKLPSALRVRLRSAPRVVVAPVGVGCGGDALRAWANEHGYAVTRDVEGLRAGRVLWLPSKRAALRDLPALASLPEVLVVDEALARWDEAGWSAALDAAPPAWRRSSYRQADGWPAALPLAARLAPEAPAELHRHPLTTAFLAPLLPPEPLRAALQRASQAPLLAPVLYGALGLAPQDVDALHDGGWLVNAPGGFQVPRLLRRHLAPLPGTAQAEHLARLLREIGQDAAALSALAEGGAWNAYLALLARSAKASLGEDALRDGLRGVPEAWRDTPAYRYLAGLLARIRGELPQAHALYERALEGAPSDLAPIVHNARGVILALQHRTEDALRSFEAATAGAGVTAGEAWHNRAGLLAQLGRHAEAEASLREAVAAFRAAGDETREARSLELLGMLYTGRGLLREAERTYTEALTLLERGAQADAFAHLNLAEVHSLLGHAEHAERQLSAARASLPDARAQSWLVRGAALLDVQRGQPDLAERALHDLLATDPPDRQLRAEAHLLLARIARERGDAERAREHARLAAPLGLRAEVEEALLSGEGLDGVIERARAEEARLELAAALLARASAADLREALDLVRTHGYVGLLEGEGALKLAALAEEHAEVRALFPLQFTLLGPLRVRFVGKTLSLTDFPTRKSAALLLSLAFTRRAQSREELAERFWPDAKNPLGSLQTAVYHLRGTLGAAVVRSERGLLSFVFPARSDTEQLDTLLRGLPDVPGQDTLDALRRAVRGVGAYLPEFPDEFEDERATAEALLRRAHRVLARFSAPGSDVRRDALRALLADDPYDFDTRVQLIEVHTLRGEGEAAEHERRRLADLKRELT